MIACYVLLREGLVHSKEKKKRQSLLLHHFPYILCKFTSAINFSPQPNSQDFIFT